MSAGPTLRVPLVDLGRQYEPIREAAQAKFDDLAARGAFILGEELRLFEEEWAAACGAAHGVGVSDGTNALALILRGLGIGEGDEVVTVPHTFIATVEAIVLAGARPVLVDVDRETACLDPTRLEAAIGPRTRAVIAVHLYGRPAPMPEIAECCRAKGVALIEDAAQAHGATLGGRRIGSLADAAAFSFYPTKNLGAMGDGGAVVTDDADLAAAVRSLRHHGAAPDDANDQVRIGTTSRLDNLQAAFLRLKLPHLDAWNDDRRAAAARYREQLADVPVELPPGDPPDGRHVYHLFVVRVDDRDAVLARMRDAGVGAAVHYPRPAHLQRAWAHLGYGPGDFPASEDWAARALSLPVFPGIAEAEVDRVAEVLRDAVRA